MSVLRELKFEDVGTHCIVSGKTYDIKEHLLDMGAAWVKKKRNWWFIPDMTANEVRAKLCKALKGEDDDDDDEGEEERGGEDGEEDDEKETGYIRRMNDLVLVRHS